MTKRFHINIILLFVVLLSCFFLLSTCIDTNSNKAKTITGITFESKTFEYDGTEKENLINGELPSGVTVLYQNNSGIESGKIV